VTPACNSDGEAELDRRRTAAPTEAVVARGVLSAPSTAEPRAIAAAFVASRHPTVELVVAHASGPVVRFEQRAGGLRVVGGGATVRLDATGAIRWTRDRTVDVAGISTTPAIAEPAAIASARALTGLADSHPATAELVIYAPPRQTPRLAWRIDFVADPATLQAPRLVLAATDGALLDHYDNVLRGGRAWAYDRNPYLGEVAEVDLEHLPDGATTLADGWIDVRTCVDDPACTLFGACDDGGFWLNLCALDSTALADADGDFLAYTAPEDSTVVDDAFAEVQLYHHLSRARVWFEGLGLTALLATPTTVVANYRDDAWLCSGDTADGPIGDYYNNAFYTPTGLLGHGGTEHALAFGNGSAVDFAWDGDVAVHELGHAVMHAVGDLGRIVRDELGVDVTPWAMHEGLADYFAIAYTGDPLLAEWIGAVSNRFAPLRNLGDDRRCYQIFDDEAQPQTEPHADGIIIAGALWDIRQGLAEADRPAMDLALFRVISALDEFDTFTTAAELVEAELEAELGATAAGAAAEVLAARGVTECNRVLPLVPASWTVENQGGSQYHWFAAPPAPADGAVTPMAVQFTFELTETADALTFSASTSCTDSTAFLKAGDEPIQWSWDGTVGTTDAIEATTKLERAAAAYTFTGPFAPGTYHVQLANKTAGSMCELDPQLHLDADGDLVGFVIGTELPGDYEFPDGVCDLDDPSHDSDCYDGVCGVLSGDPDCPDGVCVENQHWDPDCSLASVAPGSSDGAAPEHRYTVFAAADVCEVDDDDDEDGGGCSAGGGASGGALVLLGLGLLAARRRRRQVPAAATAAAAPAPSTITGTSSPSR
jgi:MYXO-CTERM domain-containing protein